MRVAGEVSQDGLGAGEGALGVDDPLELQLTRSRISN
jgi:hypothetical protein